MDWARHVLKIGGRSLSRDVLPSDTAELSKFIDESRQVIEPWLAAIFQAEHLNMLLGSGFTTAIAMTAGATAAGMSTVRFGSPYDDAINRSATKSAVRMGRGVSNIEDQFRSALSVYDGLLVIDETQAKALRAQLDFQFAAFLRSILHTERSVREASSEERQTAAYNLLQSFLLSCAGRSASRERLHIFTTNYDRFIEHGCDLAGIRMIDRFVGAMNPIFRSSRIEVDMHYNPPGIRGEPRFMEGVIRLSKLHGSLDWQFDKATQSIARLGIPFGADDNHSDVPAEPIDTVMIYPNAMKDIETTAFPYAELFRDMAASVCRPNAVLLTYGYGFGDDHINRIMLDMLSIPSTHLVLIAYSADDRVKKFLSRTRDNQVTLLVGPHYASLENLVSHYLPKPALDHINSRLADVMRSRPSNV